MNLEKNKRYFIPVAAVIGGVSVFLQWLSVAPNALATMATQAVSPQSAAVLRFEFTALSDKMGVFGFVVLGLFALILALNHVTNLEKYKSLGTVVASAIVLLMVIAFSNNVKSTVLKQIEWIAMSNGGQVLGSIPGASGVLSMMSSLLDIKMGVGFYLALLSSAFILIFSIIEGKKDGSLTLKNMKATIKEGAKESQEKLTEAVEKVTPRVEKEEKVVEETVTENSAEKNEEPQGSDN